jgi:hypothetical protein
MRALCLLGLLSALALWGCGGGGDSTAANTSTATAPPPTAQAPKPNPQTHTAPKRSTPTNAPGNPGDPTPGTKAPAPGVPVTPEGDNSIQTFGTEGQESQRQQAESDLHAYLQAKARGDWAGACEAASEQFAEELEKLIEQAKTKSGGPKPKGCAQTLELLYGNAQSSSPQGPSQVAEVLSFRIRADGYAYLIFKDPEGEVKFIAMANDNGTWKVNTTEPASFQASQGEPQ